MKKKLMMKRFLFKEEENLPPSQSNFQLDAQPKEARELFSGIVENIESRFQTPVTASV